jgi:peptidoglycan/LPS O-acetylase OafA/YrhL
MERRHDIDALRALAFALVILYHVGMYYVAGWHWHLKSPHEAEWLQMPMRALNLWRMDLVFLVSGLAMALLWRGGSRAALLGQRSVRLLLPLAFGMAVVVPYQVYAQTVANGTNPPGFGSFLLRYFTGGPWPAKAFDGAEFGVTWNHLWFLPYLWLYTALLVLALPLLESPTGRRLREAFRGLRGWRLALPVLPLLAWSLLLWRRFPPTHDLVGDGWLHAVYATLFLYGWWAGTDAGWWSELRRLRHRMLALAAALLAVYFLLPRGLAARLAGDLYLWAAILAVLGWAHHALNRPWPWLAWSNESVYPWYILHQTWIVALAFWLAPMELGPVVEPLLLVAGTVAGCWALTAVIRRSRWLRPLFGLKPRARPARPSPVSPARPAARSA